jgi:hypothetical protein
MSTKNVSLRGYRVATKPVRVKFKLKSGKTVSFKAIRTYLKKDSARFATKKK